MELLKKIYDASLVSFQDHFDCWQDAIVGSCQKLEEQGYVDRSYALEIITCIEKYGPYIVIAPSIAMPHSTMGAKGVKKTGIGLMFVKEAVAFDKNDSEKNANVFFTLAANSNEEHLQNMTQLAEMLMNEDFVSDLLKVSNEEDLRGLLNKY